MKKMMRKVLSGILSAAMLIAGLSITPMQVKAADDHTAFLMFTDRDWAFGNWDANLESATTTVSGDGTYTVTLNASEVGGDGTAAANGAMVFCVDILGAQADLLADGKTYAVTDLSIEADGVAVDVDASKLVTGDIEENGNFRIEIYNEYGDTAADSPIDKEALSFKETLTVNFTLETVDFVEEASETAVSTEQTAFLMFTDMDWAFGNWDAALESATTTVTGDGTYTVTLNATEVGGDGTTGANGANVFCVDVLGLGASVTDISAITVSDVTIEADGAEVALDASKLVTGDIEENGNFRIEIYNQYGDTAADSPIDAQAFTFADTLSVTFTISGIQYGASEATEAVEEEAASTAGEVDLNGTYHAYLGLQTPAFTFRNAFDDETYGRDTEYFNQMTGWEGNDAVKREGTFVDAEIAGNGTYTVSVDGLSLAGEFDSQDYFNLIFVSTDIPNTGAITISDMNLVIDGRNVSINPIVSPDSVNYLNMLIQNIWNEDVKTIGFYSVPPTKVEVTFTVSGFAYDNASATVEESATPETTPAADTDSTTPTEEAGSSNVVVIVVVVVVVVAAIAIVAVVLSKKKKENK